MSDQTSLPEIDPDVATPPPAFEDEDDKEETPSELTRDRIMSMTRASSEDESRP